jgi:hypothetical protein
MIPCLQWDVGLRHNAKAIVPGAQTERWGETGPLKLMLAGEAQ